MSAFSSLLSRFIQEKDVKVYSMVKYCGTDRSTMYKIISGKRNPPSEELFHKIAAFMNLAPSEYADFQRAYQISILGPETYYRRQGVERFLLTFPDNNSWFVNPVHLPATSLFQPGADCAPIKSRMELRSFLYHMFMESIQHNGRIALVFQPDCEAMIEGLCNISAANPQLRIEHILCLSKEQKLNEKNEPYNLEYLRQIMPLCICLPNYQSYYFYDDIHSHYYSFNNFPCMILTERYGISCSTDLNYGIFYSESSVVSLMWNVFRSHREKCRPLFHPMSSVPEDISALKEVAWSSSSTYVLQTEPCLTPFLDRETMNVLLSPSVENRNFQADFFAEYAAYCLKQLHGSHHLSYHTPAGIEYFASTGVINEFPDGFSRPLPVDKRIHLLSCVLQQCQRGSYRILKGPFKNLNRNLSLCISHTSGCLLFKDFSGKCIYLVLDAPDLLSAFLDYIENLEKKLFFTQKEAEDYLQDIIHSLKNRSLG